MKSLRTMNWRKYLPLVFAALIIGGAWREFGWGGVAVAVTGLVTVALVQFSRLMNVLNRAADRPKGHIDSAVMFNARLKPGVNLVAVMAVTQSIGEPLTEPDEQPELFRWTDESGSHVTCEFTDGRLTKWTLWRPAETDPAAPTGS